MSDRVLLIGNGPSALQGDLGAAVDAFDGVVARFNEFRIDGHEEQVGSRTDEWITWTLFAEQARSEYPRVLCVARPPVDNWQEMVARYPHARRLKWDDVEATIARLGYEHPSSGLLAAMTYIRAGWKVVLHGFDFFQGPSHHYSDSAVAGPKHSGTRERLLFLELIAEGQVEFLDPARQAEALEVGAGLGGKAEERRESAAGEVEAMLWEENQKLLRLAQELTSAGFRHERELLEAHEHVRRLWAERDSLLKRVAEIEPVAREREAAVRRAAELDDELRRVGAALEETSRRLGEETARLHDEARALAARVAAGAEREEHLSAEVRRLRDAVARKDRLAEQIVASDAADLVAAKHLAASAAWERERLVKSLVRVLGVGV
ncbi:MAG: hypothetical protein KF745_08595 [Phycisphaeraceae bacterium]|nr:hypothetical protein [Phycisphaeraceae bacterium]